MVHIVENLSGLIRVYQLLYICGSRQAEKAGTRGAGWCNLRDDWFEVVLVQVEREEKDDNPNHYFADEAKQLGPPDSTEHSVIVLGERVRLVENFLQFRIHVRLV